jgi:uncharacterized protein (DUF1778 family)
MPTSPARSRRLNLRATPRQQKLIRLGAEQRGMNVSHFILESACLQAEQSLADRSRFAVGARQWNRFVQALNRPPQEKKGLRRLLSQPTVLDRK